MGLHADSAPITMNKRQLRLAGEWIAVVVGKSTSMGMIVKVFVVFFARCGCSCSVLSRVCDCKYRVFDVDLEPVIRR
jgi:hypothetical protein